MDPDRLETVDDANWEEFLSSPLAVLVLTNTGCPHCAEWKRELSKFLAGDEKWKTVRFGVLTLNGEGTSGFKEANEEWLDQVEGVPFSALFMHGEPKTSFYGSGVIKLENRLKKLSESADA